MDGAGAALRVVGTRLRSAEGGVRRSWLLAWPGVVGFAAVRLIGFLALVARLTPAQLRRHLMSRYDSAYYVDIAQHGYGAVLHHACETQGPHCQYAFFPFYPALIRAMYAVLPVAPRELALAVALVAALVAAWGICAVTSLVAGRRAGVFAAVLWGVQPHAVVETIAYSESTFTALAAWSLYGALRRRWLAAAVLAVLAGLTRPTGLAVVVAVEVGIVAALWAARTVRDIRAVVAMLLAPLGWLGWVAYVGFREGAWNGYVLVQRRWHTAFDWGGYTLRAFLHIFRGAPLTLDTVEVAATTMVAIVLLVVSVQQRQPLVLLVYSAIAVALAVGTSGYFWSKSRFLLTAFPLAIPIARALARTELKIALTLITVATGLSAVYGAYLLGVLHASP
jgi:hypothetical protein